MRGYRMGLLPAPAGELSATAKAPMETGARSSRALPLPVLVATPFSAPSPGAPPTAP